jgi:hypothetical protein
VSPPWDTAPHQLPPGGPPSPEAPLAKVRTVHPWPEHCGDGHTPGRTTNEDQWRCARCAHRRKCFFLLRMVDLRPTLARCSDEHFPEWDPGMLMRSPGCTNDRWGKSTAPCTTGPARTRKPSRAHPGNTTGTTSTDRFRQKHPLSLDNKAQMYIDYKRVHRMLRTRYAATRNELPRVEKKFFLAPYITIK